MKLQVSKSLWKDEKSRLGGAGFNTLDYSLLVVFLIMLGFGSLMVYSAGAIMAKDQYGSSLALFARHCVSVLMGAALAYGLMYLDLHQLKKIAPFSILLGVVLLVLVMIPGIGVHSGGAIRWFGIGSFRFQPSELVKLFMVIYFASYIARHEHKMFKVGSGIIIPMFVVGVVSFLLLLEPDFGSCVVIVCVVFGQLLLSARFFHIIGLSFGALGALLMLAVAAPYRFRRVEAFLDPFSDPRNSGYQLIQSLIAVGSGGWFGTGLGRGQQKLYYLPASHTDFIFAVIAEELGFFGATFLVLCFGFFGYRGFLIARKLSKDPFLCSLAVGCTLLVIVPASLNIGVVLGLLPTKGLVLPLVSFGGSAMVINIVIVGLLLSLSREAHRIEVEARARVERPGSNGRSSVLRLKDESWR